MEENLGSAPTEAVPAIGDDAPDTRNRSATDAQETVLTQESKAVVPVAGSTPETGKKASFWRRIAPARAAKSKGSNEALTAQIEALAAQLAAGEHSISGRLEAIEGRVESVWEVEEQLSHLMEMQKKLDTLSRGQKALTERGESTSRLLWIAIVGSLLSAAISGVVLASAAGLVRF